LIIPTFYFLNISQFYKAYSDGAGVRHVVLTSLLLNCVGLPGFLMNLSVVLVTIRHRFAELLFFGFISS
jgi:hypothetical protein